MTIASNTGPLIALAKVDRLALLEVMFGSVSIPPSVHRELMAKFGPELDRIEAALSRFVHVVPVSSLPENIEQATRGLGAGEQQAICLAAQTGHLLLIDDRLGRQAAIRLGLKVTGSVGVLVAAKHRGFVVNVQDVLEEMRRQDYWLSDAIIRQAIIQAGE